MAKCVKFSYAANAVLAFGGVALLVGMGAEYAPLQIAALVAVLAVTVTAFAVALVAEIGHERRRRERGASDSPAERKATAARLAEAAKELKKGATAKA